MKLAIGAYVVLTGLAFAAPAVAGPDDAKWVARSVGDNAGAKVSVDIITKYCTCMNNERDNNETRSISTWEKTGAGRVAMAKCDRESGWDSKR